MKITYNETVYDCSDEHSFKPYSGREFSEIDLNDLVIYQTNFTQETPDKPIFNEKMTGVTFVKCNLSNVFIPDGNTIIDCIQTRFKCQKDLNDWEIDDSDKPLRTLNYNIFLKKGLDLPDPKDIPAVEVKEPIDLIKEAEKKKETADTKSIELTPAMEIKK